MTDATQPQTSAKVTVTVTSADDIRPVHLKELLATFREGQIEPLILGENGTPEAAVIPFAAFMRLMKYDTQAAQRDEHQLAERRSSADTERGIELQDLADELGGPAADILRRLSDDPDHSRK